MLYRFTFCWLRWLAESIWQCWKFPVPTGRSGPHLTRWPRCRMSMFLTVAVTALALVSADGMLFPSPAYIQIQYFVSNACYRRTIIRWCRKSHPHLAVTAMMNNPSFTWNTHHTSLTRCTSHFDFDCYRNLKFCSKKHDAIARFRCFGMFVSVEFNQNIWSAWTWQNVRESDVIYEPDVLSLCSSANCWWVIRLQKRPSQVCTTGCFWLELSCTRIWGGYDIFSVCPCTCLLACLYPWVVTRSIHCIF